MRLAVLTYAYVDNMLEAREPYRPGHLSLAGGMREEGRLLVAGATGDPPSGAVIVFSDADSAEEFIAADPYVEAGLVTSHTIEPWTLAVPGPFGGD